MGKGYISLFFDDSSFSLPSENLATAKENIFNRYQQRFQKSDSRVEKDLTDIIENTILKEMPMRLQEANLAGEQNKENPIKYWEAAEGYLYSIYNKNASLLENATQTLNYIEKIQNIISNAINTGQGIVSSSLINQLKQEKESLANLATKFQSGLSEDSFRGAFFGSLRGIIRNAQGSIHEMACVVAANQAKKVAEEEIRKLNKDWEIKVAATGGSLTSNLKESFEKNNMEFGRTNNPKNDLTVMVTDKDGKIQWTYGISLKSTSAKEPAKVTIMTQSATALLNKVYTEEKYLNMAAGLGLGDWDINDKRGVVGLAKKSNVSTSSSQLAKGWNTMIYNAIYEQLIDMFAGSGGALNDAQYLVINSRPISMYDLFQTLTDIQDPLKLRSIQGVEISGVINKLDNRNNFTKINLDAFKKGNAKEKRIERSTKTWTDVHASLSKEKIKISLKYAQLYSGVKTR